MPHAVLRVKRAYLAVATAVVAVLITFLFLPWVSSPYLTSLNEAGASQTPYQTRFSIWETNRLADTVQTATEGITSHASDALAGDHVFFSVMLFVTVGLLLAFLVLMYRSNRWSFPVFCTAFGCTILLPYFYMDTIFEANGVSGVVGKGLFTEFLSINPFAYLTMIIAFVFLAILLTAVLTYFTGRPVPEKPVRIRAGANKNDKPFVSRLKVFWGDILRDKHLYLMLLPFVAYFIIFYYMPYGGLRIAFMDFKILRGFEGSEWVGLKNFVTYFSGPFFWSTLRNTLNLSISTLLISFPIPILLAILFNELRNKYFRTMAQTIAYIPNFISTMVIAGLVVNFLSPSAGIVNTFLGWFGVEPIYFMVRSEYFRSIYITQSIWAGAGFGSIIYYSSLCSIDAELYEAATIDGAGRFKQILYISMPGLAGTISIMLILAVGGLLNVSTEMILLLYRPATYDVADVIGTYVFRIGLISTSPNYSLATAVGLFNGVISCLLVVSANKVSKMVSGTNIF